MSWLNDPDGPAMHPIRSGLFVFLVVGAVTGVYAYFQWTDRSLALSALAGAGLGAAATAGMFVGIRRGPTPQVKQAHMVFGIDILAMGAGAGITLFGLTRWSGGVVSAGLLLLALGLAWFLIKRSVQQR